MRNAGGQRLAERRLAFRRHEIGNAFRQHGPERQRGQRQDDDQQEAGNKPPGSAPPRLWRRAVEIGADLGDRCAHLAIIEEQALVPDPLRRDLDRQMGRVVPAPQTGEWPMGDRVIVEAHYDQRALAKADDDLARAVLVQVPILSDRLELGIALERRHRATVAEIPWASGHFGLRTLSPEQKTAHRDGSPPEPKAAVLCCTALEITGLTQKAPVPGEADRAKLWQARGIQPGESTSGNARRRRIYQLRQSDNQPRRSLALQRRDDRQATGRTTPHESHNPAGKCGPGPLPMAGVLRICRSTSRRPRWHPAGPPPNKSRRAARPVFRFRTPGAFPCPTL